MTATKIRFRTLLILFIQNKSFVDMAKRLTLLWKRMQEKFAKNTERERNSIKSIEDEFCCDCPFNCFLFLVYAVDVADNKHGQQYLIKD